jgi:hypothetical protein
METELASHLRILAYAYSRATGLKITTIGRQAAKDWRFFERLSDPSCTFTARKYDEVVGWFADHWPSDAKWPKAALKALHSTNPKEAARI